ncbi:MAG: CRISPR-associated ring nuclease Crn3/Csx3 [Synechococcales bacterium]|nr:CRISPR-associated ring nuclease Crn3/Csx3 [Synechococcales bacterium]
MSAVELHHIPDQTSAELTYQHLHIRITAPHGIIEPAVLKTLSLPNTMIWSQGIVIEGQAPIWLYGFLVHACHPAAWVACFDPRFGDDHPRSGGAVVVATHSPKVSVGEILTVQLPDDLC